MIRFPKFKQRQHWITISEQEVAEVSSSKDVGYNLSIDDDYYYQHLLDEDIDSLYLDAYYEYLNNIDDEYNQ